MSYPCKKCGSSTSGMTAKVISDPRNPRYGLLTDLCNSCSNTTDNQTLQNTLYPQSNPDKKAIDAEAKERNDRAARYQKSKEEWIAANPNCVFPDGHS